jgi:glycosyltransferase involved in cell wall biosynthesis
MKVLIDHPSPFILSHGGFQIQIEQTYAALRQAGVDVEYLRWWDERQPVDIIHYFGRPSFSYVLRAQAKGTKVVMTQLLSGLGARSANALRLQKAAIHLARTRLPRLVTHPFEWEVFNTVDACIALTPWEAHLTSYVFDAPKEKIHVVGNGVEDVFFQSQPVPRGQWLVCTATITPLKRQLEIAEAAIAAKTPFWVIGKPFADAGSYAEKFLSIVRKNPEFVRYEGAISDRAQLARIYREARGFVLLSRWESLSLSALEAAACECPLLLGDLPWARSAFPDGVSYCPIAPISETAIRLRKFYDEAPKQKLPAKPPTWSDIAEQLKKIYERVLK